MKIRRFCTNGKVNSGINFAAQFILNLNAVYVLLSVQHTASCENVAEAAAIPFDGEALSVHGHGFKAGYRFLQDSAAMRLHFVFLLRKK